MMNRFMVHILNHLIAILKSLSNFRQNVKSSHCRHHRVIADLICVHWLIDESQEWILNESIGAVFKWLVIPVLLLWLLLKPHERRRFIQDLRDIFSQSHHASVPQIRHFYSLLTFPWWWPCGHYWPVALSLIYLASLWTKPSLQGLHTCVEGQSLKLPPDPLPTPD